MPSTRDDATPFNHYFMADGKSFAAVNPNDPEELLAETREGLTGARAAPGTCPSR